MVLPMLLGALAPGLFPAMSPLLAASLGAGVGGAIQGGDLETGLLTGLGAFAGGSLLGPMLGGGAAGAGAAGGGAGAAQAAQAAGATTPAVAKAAEAASSVAAANAAANPATMQPGGLMSLLRGPAPGSTASILGTPAGGAAGSAAGAANQGMLRNAMSFAKSPTGMGVGIGSMAGPALAPMLKGLKGEDDDKKYNGPGAQGVVGIPRPPNTAPDNYIPGVSPEFDYGVAGVPTSREIIDFRDRGVRPFSDGGLLRRYEKMMGPVKMAGGGIATLAEMEDEQSQAAPAGGNEKDVVVGAIQAIKGQNPDPQVALALFLKTYGEDAFRELVDRVQSGEFDEEEEGEGRVMSGPGDGMDDMIPASIEGDQDVLLSDGEFVVPADVVSGLGNGSTDAGASALQDMMARVRASRTGTTQQPPKVPREKVLPV